MQTKIKWYRHTLNDVKTFTASWINNSREILPVFTLKVSESL